MAEVRIVTTPIAIEPLQHYVATTACGAVCLFVGQTRNHSRGRSVRFLEYDAYIPMAERELLRVAETAEARWNCRVAIAHRIGRVEVGEASVAIAVGAAHRAEAFEACRYCIDTLKQDVPIWKREMYAEGACWIEGDRVVGSS
ncbi:MAG: molybdenum cofactor biosynthesis protein MoaE [Chloroherpetonaceae bacterium]|nr:molybdenum cofactor biosynthesis protein MoaE [Chthonomonadaceae bacterium]MDW8206697.1 molybdenum cofactor biosynthesis protein MoaE [Chloroherpetonaceae bacterium]